MKTRSLHQFELNESRVSYALRRTGASRAKMRVSSRGVEVFLPRGVPDDYAREFLQANAPWVRSQLEWIERSGPFRLPRTPSSPRFLRLRGHELQIIQHETQGQGFVRLDPDEAHLHLSIPACDQKAGALLERWLRRQARADLRCALDTRSQQMRLSSPRRFYVFDQKTKWGGCSRRGNLSFSWRLVLAPPEVLDYIVVHELAHLIEPNHSPAFWLLVASHCPDWAKWKEWLRVNGEELHQGMQI